MNPTFEIAGITILVCFGGKMSQLALFVGCWRWIYSLSMHTHTGLNSTVSAVNAAPIALPLASCIACGVGTSMYDCLPLQGVSTLPPYCGSISHQPLLGTVQISPHLYAGQSAEGRFLGWLLSIQLQSKYNALLARLARQ